MMTTHGYRFDVRETFCFDRLHETNTEEPKVTLPLSLRIGKTGSEMTRGMDGILVS